MRFALLASLCVHLLIGVWLWVFRPPWVSSLFAVTPSEAPLDWIRTPIEPPVAAALPQPASSLQTVPRKAPTQQASLAQPSAAPIAVPAISEKTPPTIQNVPAVPALVATPNASPVPTTLSAAPKPSTAATLPVIKIAQRLHAELPVYPLLSKKWGEQGTVVLNLWVDEQGHPSKIQVASSSGYERLDQAARQAVSQWRYRPALRDGQPSAMAHQEPVLFQLPP